MSILQKTLRLLKGIRCVPLGPLFTEVKNNLVPHVSSTKAFPRSTAESVLYNWSKKGVQPWFSYSYKPEFALLPEFVTLLALLL